MITTKNTKLWFFFFLLLAACMPHLAYADVQSQVGNVLDIFNPAPITNGTDKSIQFLGQIFGNVDGVLQNTGTHVLGVMFAVYNSAVIALGGIVLLYTIIVGVLNTAQEGEVMGRKWSSHWITMRAAIGVALLIPKASGYCLIQIFVMWLVVQGVGAADTIWIHTLSYISDGGSIVSKGVDENDLKTVLTRSANILQMQTCIYNTQYLYNFNLTNPTGGPSKPAISLRASQPIKGASGGLINYTIYFPDKLDLLGAPKTQGICGSLSWTPSASDDKSQEVQNTAIQQMVQDLSAYAQSYITGGYSGMTPSKFDPSSPPTFDVPDANAAANAILGGALDYIAIIDQNVKNADQAAANDVSSDMKKSADNGWITAGTYYNQITKGAKNQKAHTDYMGNINGFSVKDDTDETSTQNQPNKCSGDNVSGYPSTTLYDFLGSGSCNLVNSIISNVKLPHKITTSGVQTDAGVTDLINTADTIAKHGANSSADTSGRQSFRKSKNVQAAMGLIGGFSALGATGGGAGLAITATISGGIFGIYKAFNDAFSHVDPIVGLSYLGQVLINIAGTWWIVLAGSISVMSLFTGTMSCMQPTYWAQQAFTMWTVPIITSICTLFYTSGAVLEFYVPFIPFIIFMFGVMGWFMGVIESMVAAPLVAIGLAHPEGHEAYGRAEPALMLLANIFLRPSLMLIGFITGILLSYVGLKLLNLGFVPAMESMRKVAVFDAIVFPVAMIVIYVMIVLQIVNKSFMMINEVPNNVLRWIGGAEQLGDGRVDTSSIQGAVSAGASNMGSAVGQGMAQHEGREMDETRKGVASGQDRGGRRLNEMMQSGKAKLWAKLNKKDPE